MSKTDAIISAAGTIGMLIKLVADMLGEPLADVRKRVLAQIAKDAADPTDETDPISEAIDAAMPEDPK